MSGPYMIRLDSNDGTKYNLKSWATFAVFIVIFLLFVVYGSLITPLPNVPYILACFVISGNALVVAVYALYKLVSFHKIKMSRLSKDDERDSNPQASSHSNLASDPIPINSNRRSTYDLIGPSLSPSFSPPPRKTPTESLVGLFSSESLKSRSWLFLPSKSNCRFRRSISYDSSASSISPYAYGTFAQPNSTKEFAETDGSMVEHPVYAVPNKARKEAGARPRLDPNYRLPLDCVSSSSNVKKGQPQMATRSSFVRGSDCYSPLESLWNRINANSAHSSEDQPENHQVERSGSVQDSGLSHVAYAKPAQTFSSNNVSQNQPKNCGYSNLAYNSSEGSSPPPLLSKDRSQNRKLERSDIVKNTDLSVYGAYAKTTQTFQSANKSQNQRSLQKGLVEDSDHSNLESPEGSSTLKFSNKDLSQNRKSLRTACVREYERSNPFDSASNVIRDSCKAEAATDLTQEYYYPFPSLLSTSSSSSDKTTVERNPFIWPKAYPLNQDKSENSSADSSTKQPTAPCKKTNKKRVQFASKTDNRKIQNRRDKRQYVTGMHGRNAYVRSCLPERGLKMMFADRIPPHSQFSSPEERLQEDYMGPTRV